MAKTRLTQEAPRMWRPPRNHRQRPVRFSMTSHSPAPSPPQPHHSLSTCPPTFNSTLSSPDPQPPFTHPTLPYPTPFLNLTSTPHLQAQLHPCVHPTLSPSYFCPAGLGHLHRSHRQLLRPPFRGLALFLVLHPGLGGPAHDLLCRYLGLGVGRAVSGMSKRTPQGEKIGGLPWAPSTQTEGRLQILWTPRGLGGGWGVGGRPLGPFLAQEFSTCVPTG